MSREVFNGVPLVPQIIEKIKRLTNDCPNLYFGTPEYPIPPVSCGMVGCKLLEEGCRRVPGVQRLTPDVQRAINYVKRSSTLVERKEK